MKIIQYKPLSSTPVSQEIPELLPVEILSDIIFKTHTLEEAIEELRREGYSRPGEKKLLPGIKDLLQTITDIRRSISPPAAESPISAADGNGPVKSGVSMDMDTEGGSARSVWPDRQPAGWHSLWPPDRAIGDGRLLSGRTISAIVPDGRGR